MDGRTILGEQRMVGTRVLIVEDDASWQENFKDALEGLDYAIQIAESYEAADLKLDERHFHLVLVDLRLGEGTKELRGMTLVQKVAELDEGTSTIIVSGFADATIATEALKRYNAFYVIEKDKIDPRQFVDLVQAAVSRAEEEYMDRFASAMDFLSGGQDVHAWAAEILPVLLGSDRTLGLKDLNQLRDLLNVLLDGLYPLLHHRLENGVLIDRDAGIVRGRFWSKALGEAIVLELGGRQLIEGKVADAGAGHELAANGISARNQRVEVLGALGGTVYGHADVPFEEFAS
jgi:ActR/RegA family two-component response regulator